MSTDFGFWERHYEGLSSKLLARPESKIVESQRVIRQRIIRDECDRLARMEVVLEMGAGEAIDLASLADVGANMLLAMDYSSHACQLAKSNLKSVANAHVIRGDISRMPIRGESISIVYSSGVLEHFDEPEIVLAETRSVLQRNGRIVTFVPNKSSPWTAYRIARQLLSRLFSFVPDWPVRENSFTIETLEDLMSSSGYRTERCFGIHVTYLLTPLAIVGALIGGRILETRAGRLLWYLAEWIERKPAGADMIGMEICYSGVSCPVFPSPL